MFSIAKLSIYIKAGFFILFLLLSFSCEADGKPQEHSVTRPL